MDKIAKEKIIVLFTDIRGSSRWTRRMADEEERRQAFMAAYDKESLFYLNRTNADSYKRLGDGRMFVYELHGGNESSMASNILTESLGLIKRVDRMIARLPSPRPTGFRIRVMCGIALKESYPDGEKDWIGYVPNSCHKFLAVAPEVSCVVHESFKELIQRRDVKTNGFLFELLQGDRRCPDGVDPEDMEALWSVSRKRLL
jgi:class 3 adenylate cyclase